MFFYTLFYIDLMHPVLVTGICFLDRDCNEHTKMVSLVEKLVISGNEHIT